MKDQVDQLTCLDCGSQNWAYADQCWLCQHELTGQPEIITAELVGERPGFAPSRSFLAMMSVMLAGLLLLVGIGIALEEPGVSLGFAILVLPPLLITLVRGLHRQARGEVVTWVETLLTFVTSVAFLFALIGLLIAVAIIALFMVCLVALSQAH